MHLTSTIADRRFGNFISPRKDDQFRQVFATAANHHLPTGIKWVIAPRPDFTNCLITLDLDCLETWFEPHDILLHGLIRSLAPADGCIIHQSDTAVAFFTADCPMICLKYGESLAVLHGSYRCLVRSNPGELNLIEAAFDASGFDPSQTQAFIAYGIGPCCWNPEADKPEILQPELCRHSELLRASLVVYPHRRSGSEPELPLMTVDLYRLAYFLLLDAGVPDRLISWDKRCTACHRQGGNYAYWSHARHLASGEPDGRNFAAAWLNF